MLRVIRVTIAELILNLRKKERSVLVALIPFVLLAKYQFCQVLINIRSDYDVPPTTVVVNSRFMMTSYDIPPPPVPLKNNVTRRPSNASIPSQSQLRRIATVSTSPKSSPRPPPRFRNQFETVELNPPTSQVFLKIQF